jgi:cytochrome P450 family 6
MYEIAKNPKVQHRLRQEIREMLVKNDGKIFYESLMNVNELPYLNQVFHETLRIYSILPIIDRVCTNPEGFSLEPDSKFKIPFGMPIYIPYYAIQRDEKYFPDPLKFDPERFAPENISSIQPFTNLPFGTGPRNCIGERFGIMQVKAGIVKILKDFRLETTARTPEKVVLEEKALLIQSKTGLFVNLVKDPIY